MDDVRTAMANYLWKNIMPYDVPQAISLGFNPSAATTPSSYVETQIAAAEHRGSIQSPSRFLQQSLQAQPCVDGLSDGILNQTLHYSLLAKSMYPWADAIPKDIYMEFVVPYAITNEPRTDYRQLVFESLRESLKKWERPTTNRLQMVEQYDIQGTIKEVVKLINTRLWSILGRPNKPIVFQAGLTPRIYDPLSVIAYGHSSCTGLAVLLISALRTVGIAARLAGTPAWYGDEENGNHSWLEVYIPGDDGGQWIFLEPSPGIAEGDEDTANADDLDRDPCKRWFCKSDRFNGSTLVFATLYTRSELSLFYPMAWGVGDEGVIGLNRTDYYNSVCGVCP
ncbi:hypothetical protein HJC23_013541 [Cyclotella cryptica]|uniref:Transglutaminase-like domain-containing protein n=1 Tax=Cyclotella cryptica TaxID=29204 RepID=A0ABD3P6V7_9STRA